MKIYLISFGDDNYAQRLESFRESAVSSSFFDEVLIFNPSDIEPFFVKAVGDTLRIAKGAGYWLWKPYFLRKILFELYEDDVLIYCDAGCTVNPNAKERFEEYMEMLHQSKTGTLDFELPHKEYEYTKQEIFDHFNPSDELIKSNQLMSTVVLLRKCEHSIMLINEWFDAACNHSSLFTDDLDAHLQHPNFIAPRHDQSVFSVIRKTFGANIIPDETYFLDFAAEGQKSPIWATRLDK